jgi:ribosomal-protein-alanine N-acetyltransferase
VISSPRLVLRTLTAHDAERMLAGSHPELPVFADGYPSAFATQVLRLVALYPAIDQEVGEGAPDLGPWLLLRRSDDAVIGTISCARTGNPAEMSVGYLLGLLDISRVCAETVTDHIASRRVMEKSGMRWQRDEVAEHDGREVKLAHYAIDRPEPI